MNNSFIHQEPMRIRAHGIPHRVLFTLFLGIATYIHGAQPRPTLLSVPTSSFSSNSLPLANWLVLHPGGPTIDIEQLLKSESADALIHSLSVFVDRVSNVLVCNEPNVDIGGRFIPIKISGIRQHNIAFCRVTSEASRTVYAIVGNNGAMDLFLNGILVDSSKQSRDGVQPQYVVPLSLRRGTNLFAVDLNADSVEAGFSVSIIPALDDALFRSSKAAGTILRSRVVPSVGDLELNLKITGWDDPVSPALIDGTGRTRALGIQRNRTKIHTDIVVDPGLYKFVVNFGSRVFSEYVIIGNPAEVVAQLRSSSARKNNQGSVALDIEAQWHRIETILGQKKHDKNWEFSLIDAIVSLRVLRGDVESAELAVDFPQIRAFRSEIDSSIQDYQISYPSKTQGPVPLLVIVPAVIASPRPFIDGPTVQSHLEWLEVSRIANEYGIAVLWLGYRCPPSGSPVELRHCDQVLSEVSSRFDIDPSRISLLGECSGGVFAGMIALRSPRRFASLIYHDAMFRRMSVGYGIQTEETKNRFSALTTYSDWLAASDPSRSILAGKLELPIFVVHGGYMMEGHGSLLLSVEFASAAEKARLPLKFQKVEPKYGEPAEWNEIMRWAATQRKPKDARVEPPDKITFRSVADVFAAPFMVVIGSHGAEADRATLSKCEEEFGAAWKRSQFDSWRVKIDSEVTDSDLQENLILIGSADTNSVWKRFESGLKTHVGRNSIRVGGQVWNGTNLGVQAVEANPSNPARQILMIGVQPATTPRFTVSDVAIEGWYGYAVWDFNLKDPIVAAGFQ